MTPWKSATRMLEMFAKYRFFVHAFYILLGAHCLVGVRVWFSGLWGEVNSVWRFACIECGKYPSLATFNYMVID